MRDIVVLLEHCRSLGATLTCVDGWLRVQAPRPLPSELVEELKVAKSQIMAELERQSRRDFNCWVLEEWRRTALPAWRRILQESIEAGNAHRETYARWMLDEVLEDTQGGN